MFNTFYLNKIEELSYYQLIYTFDWDNLCCMWYLLEYLVTLKNHVKSLFCERQGFFQDEIQIIILCFTNS